MEKNTKEDYTIFSNISQKLLIFSFKLLFKHVAPLTRKIFYSESRKPLISVF